MVAGFARAFDAIVDSMPPTDELQVLSLVSARLDALALRYMLTGSFAMAFYATPRMTRDLDLVVELDESVIDSLVQAFSADFYIDEDAVREAVHSARMFNLMHLRSGIKVDLIVRKADAFRRLELERRRRVEVAGFHTWVVSREDLILSKLVWAKDAASELQRRDVRALWHADLDREYLRHWADQLTVSAELRTIEQ